jgi:hypothetical protein
MKQEIQQVTVKELKHMCGLFKIPYTSVDRKADLLKKVKSAVKKHNKMYANAKYLLKKCQDSTRNMPKELTKTQIRNRKKTQKGGTDPTDPIVILGICVVNWMQDSPQTLVGVLENLINKQITKNNFNQNNAKTFNILLGEEITKLKSMINSHKSLTNKLRNLFTLKSVNREIKMLKTKLEETLNFKSTNEDKIQELINSFRYEGNILEKHTEVCEANLIKFDGVKSINTSFLSPSTLLDDIFKSHAYKRANSGSNIIKYNVIIYPKQDFTQAYYNVYNNNDTYNNFLKWDQADCDYFQYSCDVVVNMINTLHRDNKNVQVDCYCVLQGRVYTHFIIGEMIIHPEIVTNRNLMKGERHGEHFKKQVSCIIQGEKKNIDQDIIDTIVTVVTRDNDINKEYSDLFECLNAVHNSWFNSESIPPIRYNDIITIKPDKMTNESVFLLRVDIYFIYIIIEDLVNFFDDVILQTNENGIIQNIEKIINKKYIEQIKWKNDVNEYFSLKAENYEVYYVLPKNTFTEFLDVKQQKHYTDNFKIGTNKVIVFTY